MTVMAWDNLLSYVALSCHCLGRALNACCCAGREVDTMLRAFQDINSDMERTGELVAAMAKGELLKMVARNNVMRTGILSSKIGLTKRFDAAWRDAECSRIYEHLREEMEITRRYEDLEVKVRWMER